MRFQNAEDRIGSAISHVKGKKKGLSRREEKKVPQRVQACARQSGNNGIGERRQ